MRNLHSLAAVRQILDRANRSTLLGAALVLTSFALGILFAHAVDPGGTSVRRVIETMRTAAPDASDSNGGGQADVILNPGAQASFARLEAESGTEGKIEIALAPLGTGVPVILGSDLAASAQSMVALPIAAAVVATASGHRLSRSSSSEAKQAIADSQLASVTPLFEGLVRATGGASAAATAVEREFAASGDRQTKLASPAGDTTWTGSASLAFFRALGAHCLPDSAHLGPVLDLLGVPTFAEQWGLTLIRAQLQNQGETPMTFTGGWGLVPGGGYVVRQAGIIGSRDAGIAVSIVAWPIGPHYYSTGTTLLTAAAQWLANELPSAGLPSTAGCPAG